MGLLLVVHSLWYVLCITMPLLRLRKHWQRKYMRHQKTLTFDSLEARDVPTLVIPIMMDSGPVEIQPLDAEVMETMHDMETWEPAPLPWWPADISMPDLIVESHLRAVQEYQAADLPMYTFP
jgi:hypothetical protein